MVPQWQTGTVIRMEQATPNTRRYWVQISEAESFHFKPGQFVTLDMPIHEQRNKRWRSYSIASMPDDSNVIELLIAFVDGGLASEYIFKEIQVGSTFTLRGPQGVFLTPPGAHERDMYLICTGTGIAPFRSMLFHMHHHKTPHQNIHLIYGTRTREGLLYEEELRGLEEKMPGFHYHPVLSRAQWEGRKGYVHQVYEELCKDKAPAAFMLCGWREMIDEAKHRILELGYDRKDVHVEIYG